MEGMDSLAFTQQHNLFRRLSEVTEYASLTKEEKHAYDRDLKNYRDLTNTIRYAENQGMEKGMEKGRAEEKFATARILSGKGMALEDIADIVRLPIEKVKQLLGL